MLVKYSVNDIVQKALTYFNENTPISNLSPGSIARSIVEAIAPEIGEGDDESRGSLYLFMEEVLQQGFISQARGPHLDLIGGLFSFPRSYVTIKKGGEITNELIDDETYREAILKQVMSIMSANYTAIEFNLLSTAGVEDIITKEYALGAGSFKFVIIPQSPDAGQELLEACYEVVNKFKGFGIHPLLELPTYIPVDLKVELQFLESTPVNKKEGIKASVSDALHQHILAIPRGEVLVYNDIVQTIMNVSNEIYDFTVLHYAVDRIPVMLSNQSIGEEERFKSGAIEINYL